MYVIKQTGNKDAVESVKRGIYCEDNFIGSKIIRGLPLYTLPSAPLERNFVQMNLFK
jgi:hypothetical protein